MDDFFNQDNNEIPFLSYSVNEQSDNQELFTDLSTYLENISSKMLKTDDSSDMSELNATLEKTNKELVLTNQYLEIMSKSFGDGQDKPKEDTEKEERKKSNKLLESTLPIMAAGLTALGGFFGMSHINTVQGAIADVLQNSLGELVGGGAYKQAAAYWQGQNLGVDTQKLSELNYAAINSGMTQGDVTSLLAQIREAQMNPSSPAMQYFAGLRTSKGENIASMVENKGDAYQTVLAIMNALGNSQMNLTTRSMMAQGLGLSDVQNILNNGSQDFMSALNTVQSRDVNDPASAFLKSSQSKIYAKNLVPNLQLAQQSFENMWKNMATSNTGQNVSEALTGALEGMGGAASAQMLSLFTGKKFDMPNLTTGMNPTQATAYYTGEAIGNDTFGVAVKGFQDAQDMFSGAVKTFSTVVSSIKQGKWYAAPSVKPSRKQQEEMDNSYIDNSANTLNAIGK